MACGTPSQATTKQFLKAKTFEGPQGSLLAKLNSDRLHNQSGQCDFVITIGKNKMRVHKLVLAMCSSYFFKVFEAKQEAKIKKDIQALDADSVKALIEYVYTSQITITRENVLNLTAAADFLDIIEVKQFCRDFVAGFFTETSEAVETRITPSKPDCDFPSPLPEWHLSILSGPNHEISDNALPTPEHRSEEIVIECSNELFSTEPRESKPSTSRESALPYILPYSNNSNDDGFWRTSHKLPFGSFLGSKFVFQLLLDPNIEFLPQIPDGRKEGVYFVVENMENVMRNRAGLPRRFNDDSGPWAAGHLTVMLGWLKGDKVMQLTRNRGRYCLRRHSVSHECDPQPDENDVIRVGRIHMSHKHDPNYKRKITWIYECLRGCKPVCLVEYRGRYPGPENLAELSM